MRQTPLGPLQFAERSAPFRPLPLASRRSAPCEDVCATWSAGSFGRPACHSGLRSRPSWGPPRPAARSRSSKRSASSGTTSGCSSSAPIPTTRTPSCSRSWPGARAPRRPTSRSIGARAGRTWSGSELGAGARHPAHRGTAGGATARWRGAVLHPRLRLRLLQEPRGHLGPLAARHDPQGRGADRPPVPASGHRLDLQRHAARWPRPAPGGGVGGARRRSGSPATPSRLSRAAAGGGAGRLGAAQALPQRPLRHGGHHADARRRADRPRGGQDLPPDRDGRAAACTARRTWASCRPSGPASCAWRWSATGTGKGAFGSGPGSIRRSVPVIARQRRCAAAVVRRAGRLAAPGDGSTLTGRCRRTPLRPARLVRAAGLLAPLAGSPWAQGRDVVELQDQLDHIGEAWQAATGTLFDVRASASRVGAR